MMRKLLNSLPGRLVCAAAVLVMVAALLAGAVGVPDELHQATLPGRVAGLDDLLADAVGVCVGLWVARGVWR
jgi:VanZ family protein